MSLSLVSINIERSRHLDRVAAFIKERNPDVVCLQEVMERDLPFLEAAAGGKAVFAQSWRYLGEGELNVEGIAVISRLPVEATSAEQYGGMLGELPEFEPRDKIESIKKLKRILLGVEVRKDDVPYRIITTHFTWTPDGQTSDLQRSDMNALLDIAGKYDELVLTGDFNAPRGGEMFAQLAGRYRDNIPSKYIWSLDLALHRQGGSISEDVKRFGFEGYMVDGLFTTPQYVASDVELHTGVSDHCAITAIISRA